MQRGGIIHTYQKYDPKRFPNPTETPPDLVSHAFDHLLMYGSTLELTEEELRRAIRLDPSQIRSLGPSIDALRAILEERRRKILQRYETETVQELAQRDFRAMAARVRPPHQHRQRYLQAIGDEQLYDLERLWYQQRNDTAKFARELVQVMERLGAKYEIDQLAADYHFTGRTPMTVPEALAIKEQLDKIEELLKQLDEAQRTARIGIIDLEALSEFTEPEDLASLSAIEQQLDYLREMAERQGLEREGRNFKLTPKAYRLFQGKLLERIFGQLAASRTGRHAVEVVGEGAVELQATRPYEFGDSITHMDIPQSFVNALLREGPGLPIRLRADDIEIHRTRNHPKCATAVIMDMSGSMRYDGQYIHVKRMALALEGLIRSEYPGDYLEFIELYSFARRCRPAEIIDLMPKPVTIYQPVVQLKVDMSRPDISELQVPAHFTNIQHALRIARQLLASKDTPNRQIVLITDGLPTAHFEQTWLYLLYPPHPRTEEATMREAFLCKQEGIDINIFLMPSWSQSEDDIRFAHRLAETTSGRVFFTGGRDLDRYVVWDYVSRRREIIA